MTVGPALGGVHCPAAPHRTGRGCGCTSQLGSCSGGHSTAVIQTHHGEEEEDRGPSHRRGHRQAPAERGASAADRDEERAARRGRSGGQDRENEPAGSEEEKDFQKVRL